MITWEQRPDGIVVLTLDDPDQSTNTMNAGYLRDMTSTVERLTAEKTSIKGVVVTSGKDSFLVGMDLKEFSSGTGNGKPFAHTVYELAATVKQQFRRLETFGRPVVAALNGTALGGGLELGLACHHRIAVDRADASFGLPEVTLGLLPGGGGVTRVVRMLGLQEALTKVLLQGQRLRPGQAVELGLIDELVDTADDLVPRAVEWILANPYAAQPWDSSGYRMPGGRPSDRSMAMLLPAFPANLRKQLKGAHYPAPHHIMCAAVEGAAVDVDTALRIEGRWFADLVGTPIQRNLTSAFFFDLQHLNKGGSRPDLPATAAVQRVGVIGAGMMGAGIAYSCARRGIDVVLVDVSAEAAERGKAYSRTLMDKAVSRGRSTAEKRDVLLARITPTDSLTDVAGCQVVIEAVFEDLALKHETYRRLAEIAPDTLLASNTSSLPISSLAEAAVDPSRFIGLHFFSPVDKMPLVEIIRGRQTTDETLAAAYDVVRQIDKTPIVVNDSRGFFTSRVFGTYVLEGLAMLAEGAPAATVEQAALQAGYPVGPLAVVDEVTLTLPRKLRAEARKAGVVTPAHPGETVIDRMVEEYGRTGKSAGAGFYDYPSDGSPKRLWAGLADAFGTKPGEPAARFTDLKERLLFAEALEAVRCVDEGVLTGVPDGNIGSIFGIGFPPWTGGVLQFVDQYAGGVAGFVARARELAARYGARFEPSAELSARAERGTPIRAGAAPVGSAAGGD
ncbi:MAG TPA: FAD-dependent oxidoreductase [Micromonosporaceae bacterium]|jgi:3-hydroxyacyl-CoA dehydrogenase/enoyl-CoA hydratase/3-hydroxybutyryl-CoA epimerase|nr:FAD-dependent oxidoreductase [Micromonosporaceae bacterium]